MSEIRPEVLQLLVQLLQIESYEVWPKCSIHSTTCSWFCIECLASPLCCALCCDMQHTGHGVLHIWQFDSRSGITVSQISPYFDITGIQKYEKRCVPIVFFLTNSLENELGVPCNSCGVPIKSCGVLIGETAEFCSIECKLKKVLGVSDINEDAVAAAIAAATTTEENPSGWTSTSTSVLAPPTELEISQQEEDVGEASVVDLLSNFQLIDKVAIVTGGARGIGAATALLFAQNGAHVVIADVLDDLGVTLAESMGGRFIHCDVSKESDVESAVQLALTWKGKLDIMLNNAGIAGPDGSIKDLDMGQVKRLFDINVNGVIYGIKHAAKAMVERGSIICMSSSAAIMGGLGGHAYTLSKEAINGLVRSTACELGMFGIRVNSISPHGVPTEILVNAYRKFTGRHDMEAEEVSKTIGERGSLLKGRAGTVEDVAQAALFLASQESGFITGHNLVIDGGYTSACNSMAYIYI